MASFPGIALAYHPSDRRDGFFPVNTRTEIRSGVTTDKSHGGSASLQVKPGGIHDVYYGADAGERELSIWCWPPPNGKCCLQLMTRGRVLLAEAWSVGSGDWEKLSIEYEFAKGVYIVRLGNFTPPSGDSRAWFDDLV